MSLIPIGEPRHKTSVASLRENKRQHEPITCLTAYDYPAARLVDEAGIDIILVGDSLAMTVLGYENTLSITVDEDARRRPSEILEVDARRLVEGGVDPQPRAGGPVTNGVGAVLFQHRQGSSDVPFGLGHCGAAF